MAKGGGGDQRQHPLEGHDDIIILFLILIGLCVIWWLAHTYISAAYLWLKQAQLGLLGLVTPAFRQDVALLAAIPPERVHFQLLLRIGWEYKWIIWTLTIPLQVAMIVALVRRQQYRTRHQLISLAEDVKGEWPNIIPVLGKDLIKQPIDHGPYAGGQSPLEFARAQGLLLPVPGSGQDKDSPVIDRAKATEVFIAQLGSRFKAMSQFAWHERALIAVFFSYIGYQREDGVTLLRALNFLNPAKPSDCRTLAKNINASIKAGLTDANVQRVLATHAYCSTLMYGLLQAARERSGVLATAEFLWLKPMDRPLWYILNNVGRQVAWAEAAGVYSHYLREQACKKALPAPSVEAAVTGLSLELSVLPAESLTADPQQET